ncbi:MAG: hypothetical protein ACYC1M_03560 [Armatimonadota bacterium]
MRLLNSHRVKILLAVCGSFISLLLAGCGGNAPSEVSTMSAGGEVLAFQTSRIPATDLSGATVLATGKADSAPLISKLMDVNGQTEDQVKYFLKSYDTAGPNAVQVLKLNKETYAVRYWGPSSKLGRWYSFAKTYHIDTPFMARAAFALPESNNAHYVTLYKLKPGAVVVYGMCADMSWNSPTFGPYAKGGGAQLFAPNATKWVVDHAEIISDVMELVSELRYPL